MATLENQPQSRTGFDRLFDSAARKVKEAALTAASDIPFMDRIPAVREQAEKNYSRRFMDWYGGLDDKRKQRFLDVFVRPGLWGKGQREQIATSEFPGLPGGPKERMVETAMMAAIPVGRIGVGRSSKITTLSLKPTSAGTARYFGGYGRNVPMNAEFASGAFTESSVRARELENMASRVVKSWSKEGIAERGALPAAWETLKFPMAINNKMGRATTSILFGRSGLPSMEARIASAASGNVAKSGKLRGAANYIGSPIGMLSAYLYLTNDERQAEADDISAAENKAAGTRISEREQFNQDVIEAVERRSDKVVLRDWLTRKLAAYDEANANRVKTAYSEAQRTREKGDYSAASAEARTIAALATVDSANLATLMEGVDRETEAWKALRSDMEVAARNAAEPEFEQTYGYDYQTGRDMLKSSDPRHVERATKNFKEFSEALRSRFPTNGVDEIRFMTGGQYGK